MKLRALLVFLMLLSTANIGNADQLESPTGEILLTVSGDISETNAPEGAVFDLKMLRHLPRTNIETTTMWTDSKHHFSGVSLHDLVHCLKISGSSILARAINDYQVKIPLEDAKLGGPIIAFLRDGTPMLRREKGPLWIIYPYDVKPEYKSETFYARSIWQLDRIEVVD